ncbi:MAG TPA: tol-pal system protein YbgF [Candidatus Acidoferrales bacterium]|nr:tol-pal system protein YbgF [Candidatus Acidoferrales bacterium]
MRKQTILFFGGAFLAGALGSLLFSPAPVGAVAREIIELQRDVTALLQGQKDITSSLDQKHATIKTLLDQNTSAIGGLNNVMGNLQKAVQDVQANSGARLDSMSTQVQALSDNLEEVKVRLAKVNQQLADMQNTLQSIDGKLATAASPPSSTGISPASGTSPPLSNQPPSADTLYSNALRDITGGKYDLARQEFQDYLKYYPDTDLASNAQFYLGEISFAQKQFGQAAAEYEKVLANYPKSFKLAPAHLKRGLSLLEIGQKVSGIRELREVIRRFKGTDEANRASAKLKELGVSPTAP